MYRTAEDLQNDWGITGHETTMFETWRRITNTGPNTNPTMEDAVTPEEASARLTRRGFSESDFLEVVNSKIGSHEQQSDAIIALGGVTRLGFVIVENLRQCHSHDGLLDPLFHMRLPDDMVVVALKKRWLGAENAGAEIS